MNLLFLKISMFKYLILSLLFAGSLYAQSQDLYINAAFRRMEEGDYPAALIYMQKAIQLDSRQAKGYYQRALLKTRQGELKGAMADLDTALLKEPDYTPIYFQRSRLYEQVGQREMALRDISRYIHANPRDLNGYEWKISLLMSDKAERSALMTADDMVHNNPDLALSWKTRGLLREGQLDGNGAVADYSKCLELSGKDSVCLYRRAQLRFELGEAAGAVQDYTLFLKDYPEHPELWINLAESHAMVKDTLSAVHAMDNAVSLQLTDPALYISRGYLLMAIKKYAEAIGDYTKALELNTEEKTIALYNRGLCHHYVAHPDQACADWTEALNANPPLEDARILIQKFCPKKN